MTKSLPKPSLQQDILAVLAAEHRAIAQFIAALETANCASEAELLFKQLYKVLTLYHYGKTLVFYPALREHSRTADCLEVAEEQQSIIKTLLEQLRQITPPEAAFQAKLDQLKESIMGHIEEEENEIFAAVRTCMSKQELYQLGQEFRNIQTKTAPRVEARMKARLAQRQV